MTDVAPRRDAAAPREALPALGLGCSRIGSFNNPTPTRDLRALLERALEIGVVLFDTADIYGQGDSEREIGRLLRGRRDAAFVVTKAGQLFSARMRALRPLKPLLRPLLAGRGAASAVTARRAADIGHDFRPARLAAALEASLRRMKIDEVDGFLLHSPRAEDLTDEVAKLTVSLKRRGLARRVGVSCDTADCLRAALAMPEIDLVQLPVDLIDAAGRDGLMTRAVERRVGVMAREAVSLQPTLAPPAAVAAALARPGVASVVVGTSRISHLEAAAAAVAERAAITPEA